MGTGPFATMQLADQGADVIKVEPPGLGDALRSFGFWSKNGQSAFFSGLNRGKRSLVVDLTMERGTELVRGLIAEADVFVENFRPGVVQRLGLDTGALRASDPELITVSISGYGLEGDWVDRPVLDPVIQALTGHVALQMNPQIPFPDLIRHAVVDKSTSCYTAQAITAALFRRSIDAQGQHIDLSMVDASLSFLWADGMMTQALLDDDIKQGFTLSDLYSLTDCSDGQITYFCGTVQQRLGLYRAVGHPEWCDDERYNTFHATFAEEERALYLGTTITEAIATMTVDEAVEALAAHNVPVGPVLAQDAVADHPQIMANDSLVEFDDPVAGRSRQPRPPARFSRTPSEPSWPAPTPGQHTDEILAEAGLSPNDIAILRNDAVIV
jgi:crotonobetainyl-CoA:carnitine CoA-transferase CaiB-like acyl-CoA transferase